MTIEPAAMAADTRRPQQLARWGQLAAGILCMVMIANLQYGWTLFVGPIDRKYQWGTAAIQVAFSIFIATETSLVPVEGWFVDRYGPRHRRRLRRHSLTAPGRRSRWRVRSRCSISPRRCPVSVRARSTAPASAMRSNCFPIAVVSPPDSPPAASAPAPPLTVLPIRDMIVSYGYEATFLWFGLGQGLVVLVLAQLLRAPKPGQTPKAAARLTQSLRDYLPLEDVESAGLLAPLSCSSWSRRRA